MILRELSSDKNPKKIVRKFVRKRFLSEKTTRDVIFTLSLSDCSGYSVCMEDILKRADVIVQYVVDFYGVSSTDERRSEIVELVSLILAKKPYQPIHHHAQSLGKLGGMVRSEAKARASRENGKKGGRPRKDRGVE